MATSININPDVASLKKAFSDIRAEAEKTQAAIGESLDTSDATQNLQKLQAAADALKKTLAGVGDKAKVDIDVKDADAAIDDLKKKVDSLSDAKATVPRKTQDMTDAERLHLLRKSHANQEASLKRKLTERQASDADKAFKNYAKTHTHLRRFESFGDFLTKGREQYGGDFDRIRRGTLDYVSRRAGFGGQMGGMQMQRAGRLAGAMGGLAGGMIGGVGDGGMMGTAGSMIGSGMGAAVGMIGGPVGMIAGALVGNLASQALGGIGSQVDAAISESIAEGVKSANLARAFGDTVSGFRDVRDAAREAAHGMQISYGESSQFAAAYARNAAMRSPTGMMESLRDAYGFGRGLGVGQGAGVGFLSTMRGTGAAADEKAARRVGLSVAEAIQRGGLGPQADDVLTAVQQFAQTATSTALRAPDVSSFADALASGTSLNLPGLRAGNMASILQTVNSSVSGGGSAGMAGQIIINEAVSSLDRSLSVYESEAVSQGGMFSTLGKTFGRDSARYAEAQARLDKGTRDGNAEEIERAKRDMARYDDLASRSTAGVSILDPIMQQLERIPRTDERHAAIAGMFGLSQDQAAAMSASLMRVGGIGQAQSRFESAGISADKLNMGALRSMVDMVPADEKQLRVMAQRLLDGKDFKKLDKPQQTALAEAMTKGVEPMRDAILRTLNEVGGPLSDGDRAQQTQADMKNAMIRIADQLIPLTTTMKDGVLALVEKLAPDTEFGRAQAAARALEELQGRLDASAAAEANTARKWSSPDGAPFVGARGRSGIVGTRAAGRMNSFTDPRSFRHGEVPSLVSVAPFAGEHRISSVMNPSRVHPVTGKARPHHGVDVAMPTGTPLKAMQDGTIERVSDQGAKGYGKYMDIRYRDGTMSRYAHMSEHGKDLKVGTKVSAGQQVGLSGNTGTSTGPHAHIEYWDKQGNRRDFRDFVAKNENRPEHVAAPESPAERQRAAANGKVEVVATVVVQDEKGRPRNDIKTDVKSSYKPVPAGVH